MQQLKTVIHAYIHYQTSVATEAIEIISLIFSLEEFISGSTEVIPPFSPTLAIIPSKQSVLRT